MELPEIEAVSRSLDVKLRQHSLREVSLGSAAGLRGISLSRLREAIVGKTVRKVRRAGRLIVMLFESSRALVIQPGAEGALNLAPAAQGVPQFVARLDFAGLFLFLRGRSQSSYLTLAREEELGELAGASPKGLDPFGAECSWIAFSVALSEGQGGIKENFSNNTPIYGLGGLYIDEALFGAKIHPGRKMEKTTLGERKELYHALRDLSLNAVEKYGVMELKYRQGEEWRYPFAFNVYRRQGLPCLKCKRKIKTVKIKGRLAYYCPICQK